MDDREQNRAWMLAAARGDITTDAALEFVRTSRHNRHNWAPDWPELDQAFDIGDNAHPNDPRRWNDTPAPWERDIDIDPATVEAFDRIVEHHTNGNTPEYIPGDTWAPTPLSDMLDQLAAGTLTRPQPTIGRFTDTDNALYYPGRVNGLYGESGKGKSWIALALAVETMQNGGTVAWVDIEEPAEGTLARLVLDLAVDPQIIAERFIHFAPEESIQVGAALFHALDNQPPELIIIDSTGEALTLEGAGPNNDDEVATWFRIWPRRLANRYDAAVIVIDHVIKDQQNRGLFPGGSQRKRAAISGSAFMVDTVKTLGRDVRGVLKLTTAKDRQGNHRQGHKAAEFVLDASVTPTAWRLEAPPVVDEGSPFRPTHLMERVSRWLETQDGDGYSSRTILNTVTGNKDALNTALGRLVSEGYVERQEAGKSFCHRSIKPFREDTEND